MSITVIADIPVPTPVSGQTLTDGGSSILCSVRNRVALLSNDMVCLYLTGMSPVDQRQHAYYGGYALSLDAPAEFMPGSGTDGLMDVTTPRLDWWAAACLNQPVWFGGSPHNNYDIEGRCSSDDEASDDEISDDEEGSAYGEPTTILQDCGLMSVWALYEMGSGCNTFYRDLAKAVRVANQN